MPVAVHRSRVARRWVRPSLAHPAIELGTSILPALADCTRGELDAVHRFDYSVCCSGWLSGSRLEVVTHIQSSGFAGSTSTIALHYLVVHCSKDVLSHYFI